MRDRLIALFIALFVVFIWALAFFSATVLRSQLETVLSEQQFAIARHVAAEIDNKLIERIEGLAAAAANVPDDLQAPVLDGFLANRFTQHNQFLGGIAVIALNGVTIADYPPVPGRRGNYYGDRDYFRQVVASGKPYVDKPIIGRALKRPVLTIAVPVFDGKGGVRAVMTGITDLTAPNFLGVVADREMSGSGEFFIVSPHENIIVAATDGKRSMTPTPERGRNLLYDRFADGFEGSGLAPSSEGIAKLYSAKRVPTSKWIVMAALPTEIAFRPVVVMQRYLYALATFLTVAGIFLIRWLTRRALAPLEEAGQAMLRMTGGQAPLEPLPIRRKDEVGQLIESFNVLLEDRRGYEAALADSEQRFRQLVEGAPETIWVQTEGCFAYLNPAAVRLLGAASAADLIGQPIVSRVAPEWQAAVAARIRSLNEKKEALPPIEYTLVRFDGAEIDVEVAAVPIRYGNKDGALVFARDITEKKRIADELERYRLHLEDVVAIRTEELAAARDAAEGASRAKSAFLANMSHEIRTPMNAILGLTHLLQRADPDPAAADRLGKIADAGQHLLSVINDILDLSKIEAGKLGLEATDFTLAQVFGKVGTLLADKAAAKGLAWVVDLDPALAAPCRGDALRVGQILVNFAANAVKFTQRGGVTLRARCLERDADGITVRCEVVDTGIGIAADALPRLFQAFEQADGSTTRQYGGTGLGLAISRRLAELMGGEVGADSLPGLGSTFWFTARLGYGMTPSPLSMPAADPAAALRREFSGARLLLADDEPLNQEIASELLANLGLRLDIAGDGAQAVEMALATDYELILMDMLMPELDGLAATRAIREMPGRRSTPILAMTASAFDDDRQACLASGMNDHIPKPVEPEVLLAAVARWLEWRRRERERGE